MPLFHVKDEPFRRTNVTEAVKCHLLLIHEVDNSRYTNFVISTLTDVIIESPKLDLSVLTTSEFAELAQHILINCGFTIQLETALF
jgi:hypothetical protein